VKKMLALILLAVLALCALIVWMADGLQTPHEYQSPPRKLEGVEARTSTSTNELRIVSWNIAWGYGWGSEGSGGFREKEHFDRSLAQMVEVLRKIEPDVVFLQEVDFECTRSHYQDQAAILARGAGLPYVAYAVSWRANWVPFPYWPPRDHYGRMSSGGAILSRLPLEKHEVELLPKPEENPFWYNLFYLFRYYQYAEIRLGGETIPLVNTHLEAFRPQNRQAQATYLAGVLSSIEDRHLLFGGDLNAPPEEATLRSKYPDEPQTSHLGDRTVALLRAVEDLHDTVPADAFSKKESEWHTFPSHDPNRKLDYLFHGSGFELVEVRVLREAGNVSDHLPLFARVRLR
jgi:endonuclease/exonuclease/phosphatase family metal-dependent hydrolase